MLVLLEEVKAMRLPIENSRKMLAKK